MRVSGNRSDACPSALPVQARLIGIMVLGLISVSSGAGQEKREFTKQRLAPSVVSLAGTMDAAASVDVVHYDLDLTLAMTDELMGGRSQIRLVMRSVPGGLTDRVVLHAAQLQIDSASIDGRRCTV